MGGQALLHGTLLAVFLAGGAWLRRARGRRWEPAARGVLVFGVLFFLYASLGKVTFQAIPWDADPMLTRLDAWLSPGSPPVLAAQALGGRAWSVELLSFYYVAFIPYLYLTLFLGLLGRPALERERLLVALATLYGLSFMGSRSRMPRLDGAVDARAFG